MRLAESSSRSSSTEPSRSIGASSRRSFWDSGSPSKTTVIRAPPSTLMASSAEPACGAGPELMVGPGFVVALFAQIGHQVLELPIDVGLAVVLSSCQVESARYLGQRHRRVAFGDHRGQHDAWPGLDLDGHLASGPDSPSSGRGVTFACKIPFVVVDAGEKRPQVVEARQREGRAELLVNPIAEQTLGHADVAAKDHVSNGARRHELVADGDASRRRRHRHHHIIEPSKSHEVRDALAHGGGRKGSADARLNQVEQRRIRDRTGLDGDRLAHDRLAEPTRRRLDLCRAAQREHQTGAGGEPAAPAGTRHQKTYLTRTSSA